MWTCPNCKRQFRNRNQVHGCHNLKVEDLLLKRSKIINQLYHSLNEYISSLSKIRLEAVPPDVVFYKTETTFLALKLKTKWIDIEFFLNHHDDHPLVKKWLQTSKNRFVHIVSIDSMDEIDDQIKKWIRLSHQLITSA